jgi:hypothetical protein
MKSRTEFTLLLRGMNMKHAASAVTGYLIWRAGEHTFNTMAEQAKN